MEELNIIQQKPNESVLEFYRKIKKCVARILHSTPSVDLSKVFDPNVLFTTQNPKSPDVCEVTVMLR